MNFRFLKPAERELREAVAFYDKQKNGLGDEFLDEIDIAIERVLHFPKAYTPVGKEIRRIRTKRFLCICYKECKKARDCQPR